MYVYMPKNDADHMQQRAVHNRPADYSNYRQNYRNPISAPAQVYIMFLWDPYEL